MRAKNSGLHWALALALSAAILSPASLSAGPPAWSQAAKANKAGKGPKHGRYQDALSYRYTVFDKKGGPPPWAPAHGYRRKHGRDRTVVVIDDVFRPPFGLEDGFCDREVIGAVLGGAAGAAIGSRIGDGDSRTVAIIGGTAIGVLVGGAIGRAMDEADQTCVGQALEYLPDGEDIVWNDEKTTQYHVTPLATYEDNRGRFCREFEAVADLRGIEELAKGVACRHDDGAWKVLQ
ncbi:MAG TPA: glycine zipper domain-containing protein [Kiloniellaceae bacterium]|nr:glycine zipper domain-containing protein [Kiloniellaceae bacterium]